MQRFCYIGVFLLALLGLPQQMLAQRIQTISGRILDKETKKPFSKEVAVFVYGFYTIGAAEEAFKILEGDTSGGALISADVMEVADASGNYEIQLPDNGAIVYRADMSTPVLEKINGRLEINVTLDVGIQMETLSVVGMLQDVAPKPKAPTMIGNKLLLYNTYPIPMQFGKDNARLIIQPYVMDCETEDTVAYCKPLIFDGPEYGVTQDRRLNFDIAENDPLYEFVNKEVALTADRMNIEWNDTVKVPNPNSRYHASATVRMEDYTTIYYDKSMLINTCDMKRPFRFLEFSFGQRNLNPNDYRERAKRERRNTAGNIALTFLVGKSELDPENPENEIQMEKLRQDLLQIVNGEGTSLKEFHITGISSPEGSYHSNMELAKRRIAYAKNQITSVIPKNMMARVYQNDSSTVAGWDEVAALLRDTLPDLADHIMSIVERTSNKDLQFQHIARLPEYRTVIVNTFPKLRRVKYVYKHEVFRELMPEEIMDRYLHDPDYRSGKKEFALYEFWHLFQMVKDPMQLEELYRRAYKVSAELNNQPWILAANNLAVSYLKRDTFDVQVLKPFIDRKTRGVNVVRKLMNGVDTEIINPEAVVANHLAMCIKANDYDEASVMAQILPNTPENEKIKAFALCLGGYYQGGNTPEEREQNRNVFNLVRDSSPVNAVVMHLAMENKGHDVMAEKAVENLDKQSALYWYLKGVINNRKGDLGFEDAKNSLIQCFKKDEKYIAIAATDGDIGKDLYEYTMEMYELEKELMMLQ